MVVGKFLKNLYKYLYMVLVSHKKKFIYIKNYKVAGTSVEVFFEQWCKNKNDIVGVRGTEEERKRLFELRGGEKKLGSHVNISKVLDVVGTNVFNDYFKFCIIRNPYDKMVSAYFFKVGTGIFKGTFKQFCKTGNKAYNFNRYSINNVPQCDFYIRFENLVKDTKKVCELLNIKRKVVLPSFKSEYRPQNIHYSKYYDEETKEIVYKMHKKEFEIFGYKFEKK